METKKEVSVQVQGMTCAACANKIEKGLNKIDDVIEANVNFAIEKTRETKETLMFHTAFLNRPFNIQRSDRYRR